MADRRTLGLSRINLLLRINTWVRPQRPKPFDLVSATAWDGTAYQSLIATPNGGTFSIANPSVLLPDTYYTLWVPYTTSHGLTWGTTFKGVSSITPTATAGAYDHFAFRTNAAASILACVGYGLNVGA